MGILSGLLDATGIGGKIVELINKRVPDKDLATNLAAEAAKLIEDHQHELAVKVLDLEGQIAAAQSATNQIEAGSESGFKSNWRPAIGWICGSALGYQMLLRPLLAWASQALAWMPPPSLEMDTLMTLLFAILGLGAYRSAEKIKGAAR